MARLEPVTTLRTAPSENDRTSTVNEEAIPNVADLMLEATRSLLWIHSPDDAVVVTEELINALGASVVTSSDERHDVLELDVSFGVGPPRFPSSKHSAVIRERLERYLPNFVLDARRALELAQDKSRFALEASVDSLTGLSNRRMVDRQLGRLRSDDTVVVIDIDNFKLFNDNFGHSEGDRILHAFGQALSSVIRATDRAGRYGGDEFVVILAESAPNSFFVRLQRAWSSVRPHAVTFSAGLAQGGEQPELAFIAADRAMYRAKQTGRNQYAWANDEDRVASTESSMHQSDLLARQ